MGEEIYSLEELISILPEGWQEKAKELGALRRAREIKTPEDLLKLNFLYLTTGKSFGNTAVLLQLGNEYHLNKIAVYNRIGNSEEWLRWLCEHICRQARMPAEKPAWLEGKTVCLVDASDEPVYGSSKTGFRLCYCIDLFDLSLKEMHLTGTEEEEKLSNFQQFGDQDVVIGEKAYGTIQGIEYLRRKGCDFALRYRTNAFTLYNREHQPVEVIRYFEHLQAGKSDGVDLYYREGKEYKPIRLCAEQSADNGYVIVASSLTEVEPALIMELYRFQRQLEQVFKRLKSLFHYNEIPSKVEKSGRAWFYGKLLLASGYETLENKGRLPPQEASMTAQREEMRV
jgi:hypothetical protein